MCRTKQADLKRVCVLDNASQFCSWSTLMGCLLNETPDYNHQYNTETLEMGGLDEGDIQNVYYWGGPPRTGLGNTVLRNLVVPANLPGALISERALLLSPTANSSRPVNYKPCCGTLTHKIIVNIDF